MWADFRLSTRIDRHPKYGELLVVEPIDSAERVHWLNGIAHQVESKHNVTLCCQLSKRGDEIFDPLISPQDNLLLAPNGQLSDLSCMDSSLVHELAHLKHRYPDMTFEYNSTSVFPRELRQTAASRAYGARNAGTSSFQSFASAYSKYFKQEEAEALLTEMVHCMDSAKDLAEREFPFEDSHKAFHRVTCLWNFMSGMAGALYVASLFTGAQLRAITLFLSNEVMLGYDPKPNQG